MEQDPFNFENKNPERDWSFFEKEKTKPEKETTEESVSKWFEKEKKPEKEPKDDKVDSSKEKTKPTKPELPASDSKEFKELPKQQQKQVLAKEYVQTRSTELEEELARTDPTTPEAAEIIADLELIAALDEKLDNPEIEVEEAIERAYEQIMERLDEILAEPNDQEKAEDESLEAELDTETLSETTTAPVKTPLFTARQPVRRNSSQAAPTVHAVATVGGSTDTGTNTNPAQSVRTAETRATTNDVEKTQSPIESVRKKRAGKLAVSEALSQMLGRRYESADQTPAAETFTRINTPERVINPIKRTIAEKERQVRRLVTKQVVEAPFIEALPVVSTGAKFETGTRPEYSNYQLESTLKPITETYSAQPEQRAKPVSKEIVRNLQQSSTAELLTLANNVRVEGTTLRRLFETNQVDRSGMIKVLKEALKGGDVKKAFAKSRLGEEVRRGRAIETRHDDPMIVQSNPVTQSQHPAAKARTEQLLAALESVKKQTSGASAQSGLSQALTPNQVAAQKAQAAKTRAVISITAAIAVALAGLLVLALFVL